MNHQKRTGILQGAIYLVIICSFLILIYVLIAPNYEGVKVPKNSLQSVGKTYERDVTGTSGKQPVMMVDDILDKLQSPVLVVTVNIGFLPFLYNLLCSISRLHLRYNILIICEDKTTYDVLRDVYHTPPSSSSSVEYIHVALTSFEYSDGAPADKYTAEYFRLMQKRVTYIYQLISKGKDVLFIDADIVLLGDPFQYFLDDHDIYVQPEYPEGSKVTEHCAGFFYMRSTNSAKQFLLNWQTALGKDEIGNQKAFGIATERSKIKIQSLSSQQFSSGKVFFSSNTPWYDRKPQPVEVHANFIIGHDAKVNALANASLWFANGSTCISP